MFGQSQFVGFRIRQLVTLLGLLFVACGGRYTGFGNPGLHQATPDLTADGLAPAEFSWGGVSVAVAEFTHDKKLGWLLRCILRNNTTEVQPFPLVDVTIETPLGVVRDFVTLEDLERYDEETQRAFEEGQAKGTDMMVLAFMVKSRSIESELQYFDSSPLDGQETRQFKLVFQPAGAPSAAMEMLPLTIDARERRPVILDAIR